MSFSCLAFLPAAREAFFVGSARQVIFVGAARLAFFFGPVNEPLLSGNAPSRRELLLFNFG